MAMNSSKQTALLAAYLVAACVVVLGAYGALAAGASFGALLAATATGAVLSVVFAVIGLIAAGKLGFSRQDSEQRELLPHVGVLAAFLLAAAVLSAAAGVLFGAMGDAAEAFAASDRFPIDASSPFSLAALLVICYALTGIFEETFFRGVLLHGLASAALIQGYKRPLLVAVVVSSAAFALVHVAGCSFDDATSVVQVVLKVVSAFEFGVVMAALYLRSGALVAPIVAHAAFDVVSNVPIDMALGSVVATYATGTLLDFAVPLATIVALAWPTVRTLRIL